MPRHHHHRHPHDEDELPPGLPDAIEAIQRHLQGSGKIRRLSRAAFEDGPYHRRVANAVLCGLVQHLAAAAAARHPHPAPGYAGPVETFELDLPPHLRGRHGSRGGAVRLPTRLLAAVCPDEEGLDEVIDGLVDGPHHEVAANVILIRLLESLYDGLLADPGAPPPAAVPA